MPSIGWVESGKIYMSINEYITDLTESRMNEVNTRRVLLLCLCSRHADWNPTPPPYFIDPPYIVYL